MKMDLTLEEVSSWLFKRLMNQEPLNEGTYPFIPVRETVSCDDVLPCCSTHRDYTDDCGVDDGHSFTYYGVSDLAEPLKL